MKFNVILADPPWDIGYLKGGKTAGSIEGGEKLPYDTMSDEDIMSLQIEKIAHENCFLFLWAIDSKIPLVKEIMENWGFRYNSVAFVWNKITKTFPDDDSKVRTTLTPYTRKSCEFCFLGLRGKTKDMVKDHTVLQYTPWASTSRLHSLKPPIKSKIDMLLGYDIPKVELFARDEYEGWTTVGNEIGVTVEQFIAQNPQKRKLNWKKLK